MLRVYSTSYSMAGKKPAVLLRTVRNIATVIRDLHEQHYGLFDAVAFRGTSGYSVAFLLQSLYTLPVPLVLARKEAEQSHGGMFTLLPSDEMEDAAVRDITKVLLVDDLVCTGGTVRKLKQDLAPWDVAVSGVLCYSNDTGNGYEQYRSMGADCQVFQMR